MLLYNAYVFVYHKKTMGKLYNTAMSKKGIIYVGNTESAFDATTRHQMKNQQRPLVAFPSLLLPASLWLPSLVQHLAQRALQYEELLQ